MWCLAVCRFLLNQRLIGQLELHLDRDFILVLSIVSEDKKVLKTHKLNHDGLPLTYVSNNLSIISFKVLL